ncbi:MAG: lipocalin-like domain-containing protein [Thermomicrobiales bacterium]
MNPERLQTVSRLLDAPATRRHAFHGIGASALAIALAGRGLTVSARASSPATPATHSHDPATPTVEVGLDALDDETKDNIAQALWLPEWDEAAIADDILQQLTSAKNSNKAYGERMTARLRALIDDPETFTPSHAARYEAFLDAFDSLSPHQAYVMSNLLGPDSAHDFPPLPKRAEFEFPQSHAVDLPMQVGWYFVVGSCTGSNGKEYGVEMMFFRNALVPPAMAREFGLTDTENQVTELHFAVTEAGAEHHRAIPTVIAGTTGLLEFSPDGLGWSMGKNTIQSLDPQGAVPLQFRVRGVNRGGAKPIAFSVDITCATSDAPTPQGVEGCDPCCDGAGTLYYSLPNLQLDPARSTLTLDGEEVELVSGRFWFDHQWGNSLVASPRSEVTRAAKNVAPPTIVGWDWFMAQFDSGHQISGSTLHTEDNLPFYFQTGDTPPGPMHAPVKGRLMSGDGTVQLISGKAHVDEWVQSTGTPDPEQYWPTNAWYPNHWPYEFGEDAPAELRAFSMEPIVAGGQSGFFASGAQYSEGAVFLRDAHGKDVGRGFAESVNYANTMENIVALSGLEVTDELSVQLQPQLPSKELVAESTMFVVAHQKELTDVIAGCIGL